MHRIHMRQSRERALPRQLKAALEEWQRHRETTVEPATSKADRTAIGHLLDYFTETANAAEAIARLQDFVDHLGRRGYRPRTITSYATRTYAFADWADLKRPRVKLPKLPEPNARFWSDEELVRLQDAADYVGPHARLALELAVAVGLRQQELFALGWRALNSEQRTARVTEQLDRSRSGRRRALKGGQSRTTLVLPSFWAHLDAAVPDWRSRVGIVLVSPTGGVYSQRQQIKVITAILTAARLAEPGVAWHSFRHTYGRLVLEGGGSLEQLRLFLGHANITTTDRIYGHLTEAAAVRIARERIFGTG